MSRIAVENDTIKVRVSQKIWDSYREKSEYISTLLNQTPDQIQRGLVLSDAMSKIGNASELKKIKAEPIDPAEIHKDAHHILFCEYLSQHCHYNINDVLMRFDNGARLSAGMQVAVDEAHAYADGIMAPISNDQLMQKYQKLTEGGRDPHPREVKKLQFMRNFEQSSHEKAIDAAMLAFSYRREIEIRYRTAKSNMDDWDIEIKGTMPGQIGMCGTTM